MNKLAQRKKQRGLYQIIAVLLAIPASGIAFQAVAAEPSRSASVDQSASKTTAEVNAAELAQQSRCSVCHDMTNGNLLGPSYTAIALRYSNANKDVMTDVLAEKIIAGGGLNWGTMVMVPNEHVSWEHARTLAKWILGLKPSDETPKP